MAPTDWKIAAQGLNAVLQGGGSLQELDAAIASLSGALQTEIPPVERPEAFSTLSRGFRRRFLLRGAASDAADSAKAAKLAIDGQANVPGGMWIGYAQALTEVYETSGDLGALGSAKDIYETLIKSLGVNAFDPQVAGLAQSLLLHYRRCGNLSELQETYGLVLPLRYAKTKPPALSFYVYGCACREFYRRSGSVPQLDESIKALAILNQPDSPVVLKFVAEYAEALIDRYRIFPAEETLELAINLAGTAIDNYMPAAGTPDCQIALGYAYFLRASAAEHAGETYEGAPIVYKGLDQVAAGAVRILQRAADSMLESAPRLPLCLARLGEAMILLSRFNKDPQLRQDAVKHCERAVALLPQGSADTAAVRRRLAYALKWRDGVSIQVAENYALAARSGATSDLLEGLVAAVEWSRLEPLRAFPYVDAALDSLYGQLRTDGLFTLDLIQESSIWTGDGGIIGGHAEVKRWHRPAWMKLADGISSEVAYAWVQAGRPQEGIIALERRPMIVLDCGHANASPPSWPQLVDAAAVCPLVYLSACASGGCALVLDPKQSPAAKSILLPGLTAEAVATWLHGPPVAAEDLEGFNYAMGYIPSPADPGKGGLIAAYTFWQLDTGKKNQVLWFRPLDDCGKWLGENQLAALEHAIDAKQIVLILSGELAQLPLAAAWVEDASRPTGRRYLGDSFTVRYAPSARILLRPPSSAATDSFFGVADPKSKQAPPLTYAPAEVAVASSTFTARQVVSDSAATVTEVQAGAGAATVLHLACHAFSNFQYANDSMILLAGDDVLTLWDVVRMDFSRAQLILLSACESGKITRKISEQAVSFSSAFLGAGAAAVIATGWNVDDPATCVLILRFYYQWRIQQLRPATALQEAQQWLRDTTNDEKVKFCETLLPDFGGKALFDVDALNTIYQHLALLPPAERTYAHPHYWAAFLYSGSEIGGVGYER